MKGLLPRMLSYPSIFNSYITKKIEYATRKGSHFGGKYFNPIRNVKNSQALQSI